jgi:hypothetical protein
MPGNPGGVAIAPDGRTAYVLSASPGSGSVGLVGEVTPVDTRDQAAGRAVAVAGEPVAIVIAP